MYLNVLNNEFYVSHVLLSNKQMESEMFHHSIQITVGLHQDLLRLDSFKSNPILYLYRVIFDTCYFRTFTLVNDFALS